MGLGSNVSRRPHFGRSPPLALAFLGICCFMLVLSYWRLSVQYNDLERLHQRLAQKKDSLEANEKFISQQLELREENFSKAKVSLQQKEQEIEETKRRIEAADQRLKKTLQEVENSKAENEKLQLESDKNVKALQDLEIENKRLGDENQQLSKLATQLKERLKTVFNVDAGTAAGINKEAKSPAQSSPQVMAAVPISENQTAQLAPTTSSPAKLADNAHEDDVRSNLVDLDGNDLDKAAANKPADDKLVDEEDNKANNNAGGDDAGGDEHSQL